MRAAHALLLGLLLAGCAQVAGVRDPDVARLDELKAQREAGQFERIATAPPPCTARGETCAQSQQIRADACMTLARRAPAAPAAAGQRDCAITAYLAARAALPEGADPARAKLLLTNAAAAAQDQRDRTGRGIEQQLAAGQAILALDPRDPAGCWHTGSASLARALLTPAGPARCAALPPAGACAGVGPPFGVAAGSRLPFDEIAAQRQRLACP